MTEAEKKMAGGAGVGDAEKIKEPAGAGVGDPASPQLMKLFNSLLLNTTIPKPDLKHFGGDPASYYTFLHSFETNIASRIDDDNMKLTYLIQFCDGKAKEAIPSKHKR